MCIYHLILVSRCLNLYMDQPLQDQQSYPLSCSTLYYILTCIVPINENWVKWNLKKQNKTSSAVWNFSWFELKTSLLAHPIISLQSSWTELWGRWVLGRRVVGIFTRTQIQKLVRTICSVLLPAFSCWRNGAYMLCTELNALFFKHDWFFLPSPQMEPPPNKLEPGPRTP